MTKKFREQMLSKLNNLYNIGKLFKCKYLKWSCIFNLTLWTKNYDENKICYQISKVLYPQGKGFFPWREKDSIAQGKRGVEKFDLKLFFWSFKFSFIISNWYNKSTLNSYVSRALQWYKECLIWMLFAPWTFFFNLQELVLRRNCSLIPFSLGEGNFFPPKGKSQLNLYFNFNFLFIIIFSS